MEINFFDNESSNADQAPPENDIGGLMKRLKEINPLELADALSWIESHQNFPKMFVPLSPLTFDQTKLFLSRGLKREIETIYLELARHLRGKTEGSHDLMNAVFDFFSETLKAMVRIPHLVSQN